MKEEYRMYHLVMYNISPIQQGIQAYHSGVEYALRYGDTKEYKQWAKIDKTIIILNGGTSNIHCEFSYKGTMENHIDTLLENNIKIAWFNEQDLNNSTSAIAFLVSDKVWDKEKYPDFPMDSITNISYDDRQKEYIKWRKLIGKENIWLREFLSQFRLA